ncbi:MAG TPA: universal stress protein [Steroidobacteraceae bacterium]|nr:universal stress protein [Steroidobacteraceae bacterium]
MTNIRRILFAVRNPEAARQPGLAKAIQVARAFDATLELFHALCDSVFIELSQFEDDKLDRLRERVEEEARLPLSRLCEAAHRHGVQAECSVQWDYPPHEAIVRRATKTGADLIIAECHKGARTRPWLIHLTDWELLRISPLPVLLLKNGSPYRRPLTLAAVDPARAHVKPRDLDSRIVATATEFSRVLRGELHVMHANYPNIAGVPGATPATRTTWSTLTYEELMAQERQAFEAFRASAGLRRTRTHLVDGNPAVAIPRFAREMGAGIVVMGALARSGLKRVLIGNTAERVLDALPCDVLVVKPEQPVTRTAQKTRDVRVIASATRASMAS